MLNDVERLSLCQYVSARDKTSAIMSDFLRNFLCFIFFFFSPFCFKLFPPRNLHFPWIFLSLQLFLSGFKTFPRPHVAYSWREDTKISRFAAEFAGCVWTEAVSGKEKLRIQKYWYMCGRDLNNNRINCNWTHCGEKRRKLLSESLCVSLQLNALWRKTKETVIREPMR